MRHIVGPFRNRSIVKFEPGMSFLNLVLWLLDRHSFGLLGRRKGTEPPVRRRIRLVDVDPCFFRGETLALGDVGIRDRMP